MSVEIWYRKEKLEGSQLLVTLGEGLNFPFTAREVAGQMVEGLRSKPKCAEWQFEIREDGMVV